MTTSSPARTDSNAGILIAGASLLVGTSLALAAESPVPPGGGEEEDIVLEAVVVTGSHVRKDEFNSPSPIQVITREGSVLAGLSTTTDVLQGSTVSGGGNQINNYFGGYVVDGGPGVNTLSLRGLGAVRTLILLNGRRLAPAGTRGSVGSADLNVLPTAIVDRIEILKDGASSTYGSDAVAGVVNIITRSGMNGWNIEGHRNSTFDGGGNITSLSLSGGMSSDRGQLLGSFEVYDRSNLAIGDRDWASCPTQVLIDPQTGDYAPGSILNQDGTPRCFPISSLTGVNSGIAHNYIVAPVCELPDYDPCVFVRATPDTSGTTPIPGWRGVDPLGDRPAFDPRQLRESLISPTRNYTGFLSGAYDTGVLGNGELYFEGMFHRRESKQIGTRQLSLDYQVDDAFNNHPFVPDVLYAPGPGLDWGGVGVNPFGNWIIARGFAIFGNDVSSQEGDFSRLVGGLRGNLTFADWEYDVNVTVNRGDMSYTFESALNDAVYNSMYVTPVAPGFNAPTRVGFDGLTYTCEVNVTNPGTGCVPVPLLDAQFLGSNIPQDYRDYIWHDITGNTVYKETTASAILNGPIANLPYGRLRGAIGVEARWMELDDTPDENMLTGNLYGFSSAGITRGKDKVKEVFGELDIPLLAGVTGAQDLTLNLSGRYTDYDSYGSDTTYKIGMNYSPAGWMRLRATTGTSYRAPAIFEQYLSPTSGFIPQANDPCHLYGSDNLPGSTVYENCASEGLAPTFSQGNSIQVNSAGGAELGLSSEDSRANTVGLILQPPLPEAVGDLSFAIDWWKIKVDNQVAQIGGANLLNLCYQDPDFRAGGSYCTYSTRDSNNELTVEDNYINIAEQIAAGMDFNLRFTRDFGVGEFVADLRATRYSDQKSRVLPTDDLDEFNGEITAPRWVGDMDLRYEWKSWTAYYGLIYVGTQNSNPRYEVDPNVDPFDLSASAYFMHNLAVKYTGANDWQIIAGMRNLTDTVPKSISPGAIANRQGNSFLYSGYDYYGRRAYLTLSKSF